MKPRYIDKIGIAFLERLSLFLVLSSILFFMLLIPSHWGSPWRIKNLFLIYSVSIVAFIQIFIKKDKFVFTKIDAVFLGFIAWNFLSYFWATNPSLIWEKSFSWLFLYCLFKTVSSIDFSKINFTPWLNILFLSLIFNNLMLAWFYFEISTQGDSFGISYLDIFQIREYLGSIPNRVGCLLAMTFPMYILLWHYQAKWKFLVILLASFHLLFLMGLNCRGAFIAVILQLTILGLMHLKKLKQFIWLLPIGLVCFLTFNLLIQDKQHFYKKFNPLKGVLNNHDERLIMWESSIKVWQENIWLGKGTGNWLIEAPKYPLELFFGYDSNVYYQHPHNIYLHILSELGLVGLSTYMALIFYFLFLYLKKIRTSNKAPIYQVLLLILVGYLVISSFFGIVYSERFHPVFSQVLLFLSFGMGMALHQQETITKQSYKPLKIFIFLFACVYIASFYFSLEKTRLQHRFINLKNKGKHEKALETFDTLYDSTCYTLQQQTNVNMALKTHQALIFWKQQNQELAINTMFEAVEDQPHYHMNWFHFGNMYYQLRDYENAKICYENVYNLRDNFMKAQIKLVEINLAQGNRAEAEKWFGLVNERVNKLVRKGNETTDEQKFAKGRAMHKKFKAYKQQLIQLEEKLRQL